MENSSMTHANGAAFEKEVLNSDLPVVVDFYADWCGPCRMVSPTLENLSKEYVGKVKFLKVDTDENQDLAERYEILSIPTVMLFSKGEVKARIVGAAPGPTYKQKIDALLKA